MTTRNVGFRVDIEHSTMADAFGIAAGVLQVAGFGAEVGSALWRCTAQIYHANKELVALAGQVEATSKSLDAVGRLLKQPETKALRSGDATKLYDDTHEVSKGCKGVFDELDFAVRRFQDRAGKSRYQLPLTSRIRWSMESNRLVDLQKVLMHYRDVLHLMVSVLHIAESRQA